MRAQSMVSFTETPLLVAEVFGYQRTVGSDQDALRRALGQRVGVEAFAAAAGLHGCVCYGIHGRESGTMGAANHGDYRPLVDAHLAGLTRVALTDGAPLSAWDTVTEISDCTELALHVSDHGPVRAHFERETGLKILFEVTDLVTLFAFGKRGPHGPTTRLPDGLFEKCLHVTSVDLSGLSTVTSIGHGVMSRMDHVTSVNLSGLTSVTSIGDSFLARAFSLETLDLSGFSRARSIGDRFLWLSRLSRLDLSPLTSLTRIGSCFVENACGLESVDLSGLSAVTSIGDSFLAVDDSSPIAKSLLIDVSGLTALTECGAAFLERSIWASTEIIHRDRASPAVRDALNVNVGNDPLRKVNRAE